MASSDDHAQDATTNHPLAGRNSDAQDKTAAQIREVVDAWKRICPGDINGGYFNSFNGFIDQCGKFGLSIQSSFPNYCGDTEYDDGYDLFATLHYRLSVAHLVDKSIIAALNLPKPDGLELMEWYEKKWKEGVVADPQRKPTSYDELSKDKRGIWNYMVKNEFSRKFDPCSNQGPIFDRPIFYVVAAIYDAQLDEEAQMEVMKKIITITTESSQNIRKLATQVPDAESFVQEYLPRIKRWGETVRPFAPLMLRWGHYHILSELDHS